MKIHDDIVDRYDSLLARKTRSVECIPVPGYTYPHLRWMLSQIRSGEVDGEKSHRWLGFIQGVLVREGHLSVSVERDFTRPYFKNTGKGDKVGKNWEFEDSENIYFWGGILSNWASFSFEASLVQGKPPIIFGCSEQYMMARKAILFGDYESFLEIMRSNNPSHQKAIGRTVDGFDDAVWSALAREYTYPGNLAKFLQNDDIRKVLIEKTGNRGIVEASPKDRRWGVGFDWIHAPENKDEWGNNWLGQCLMRVRDEIRTGSPKPWTHYENWKY